jgi:hypothetical protein
MANRGLSEKVKVLTSHLRPGRLARLRLHEPLAGPQTHDPPVAPAQGKLENDGKQSVHEDRERRSTGSARIAIRATTSVQTAPSCRQRVHPARLARCLAHGGRLAARRGPRRAERRAALLPGPSPPDAGRGRTTREQRAGPTPSIGGETTHPGARRAASRGVPRDAPWTHGPERATSVVRDRRGWFPVRPSPTVPSRGCAGDARRRRRR